MKKIIFIFIINCFNFIFGQDQNLILIKYFNFNKIDTIDPNFLVKKFESILLLNRIQIDSLEYLEVPENQNDFVLQTNYNLTVFNSNSFLKYFKKANAIKMRNMEHLKLNILELEFSSNYADSLYEILIETSEIIFNNDKYLKEKFNEKAIFPFFNHYFYQIKNKIYILDFCNLLINTYKWADFLIEFKKHIKLNNGKHNEYFYPSNCWYEFNLEK